MCYLVLVLVCIKLSVLHFCSSDNVHRNCECDAKTILLQSHDNNEIKNMNYQLNATCGHIYNFEEYPYTGISGMMEAVYKSNRYVINLGVDDYYKFNWMYTSSVGLAYAGDLGITSSSSPNTCSVNNDTETKDCSFNYVKMVSDDVTEINGGHLYNLITKMQYNNDNEHIIDCSIAVDNDDLDIVLICSDTDIDTKKFNQQFCPLRFKNSLNCDQVVIELYKNKLLAVLTSKPFDIDYDLAVPIIFYDTPFSFEKDVEIFSNYVLSDWKKLKYPILKFLEAMNWRKVAIITDDSPYSAEFEEELTELFREHLVMYTVKRCETRISCKKFFESSESVLEGLKNESTAVLIANFQEKFIHNFKWHRFGWILRDLTSSGVFARSMGYGNSITLAPAGHDASQYSRLGLDNTLDKHTKIVENVKHIYNAYKMASQSNINNIPRKEFYRQLAKEMRTSIQSMDYVSHAYDKNNLCVGQMSITSDGQATSVAPFTAIRVVGDVPDCTFKSNTYSNPCNDNEFILIMLVLIVFATSLLLVTIYFHKSSPVHGSRYVPF